MTAYMTFIGGASFDELNGMSAWGWALLIGGNLLCFVGIFALALSKPKVSSTSTPRVAPEDEQHNTRVAPEDEQHHQSAGDKGKPEPDDSGR